MPTTWPQTRQARATVEPTMTVEFMTSVCRGRYERETPVAVTYTADAHGNVKDARAVSDTGNDLTRREWETIDEEIEDRVQADLEAWLSDQCEDYRATASEATVPAVGAA